MGECSEAYVADGVRHIINLTERSEAFYNLAEDISYWPSEARPRKFRPSEARLIMKRPSEARSITFWTLGDIT